MGNRMCFCCQKAFGPYCCGQKCLNCAQWFRCSKCCKKRKRRRCVAQADYDAMKRRKPHSRDKRNRDGEPALRIDGDIRNVLRSVEHVEYIDTQNTRKRRTRRTRKIRCRHQERIDSDRYTRSSASEMSNVAKDA